MKIEPWILRRVSEQGEMQSLRVLAGARGTQLLYDILVNLAEACKYVLYTRRYSTSLMYAAVYRERIAIRLEPGVADIDNLVKAFVKARAIACR